MQFSSSNISWKGSATTSAVPTMSRPLQPSNIADSGPAFKARPMKHWRFQLIPTENSGRTAASISSINRPGGSNFLASGCVCADASNATVIQNLPFKPTPAPVATLTASGECISCDPESNVIKSAVTLLNKNYYTDTKAFLQSRCQTYDQKQSLSKDPAINYGPVDAPAWPNNTSTGPQNYLTEFCPQKDNCRVTTIYKPSNRNFAVQGAVSSSGRVAKLKYDTITKNGNSFRSAFGDAAANAGKYNPSGNAPYFIKSKTNICQPSMFHMNGNKTMCPS